MKRLVAAPGRTIAQPPFHQHGRYRGFDLATMHSGVVIATRPGLTLRGFDLGRVLDEVDEAAEHPAPPLIETFTDAGLGLGLALV